MVARDLKKFPHEVSRMPYRDARDLAEMWREFPPEFVCARIVARYTPPEGEAPSSEMTADDIRALKARGL
jgi:hypothetical protein